MKHICEEQVRQSIENLTQTFALSFVNVGHWLLLLSCWLTIYTTTWVWVKQTRREKQVQMYLVSIGVGGGVLGYFTRWEAPGGVGGRASPSLLLPLGGGVSGNSSLTLNLQSTSNVLIHFPRDMSMKRTCRNCYTDTCFDHPVGIQK